MRAIWVAVVLWSSGAVASEGWELGVRGWYSGAVNDTFGSRPELQVSGEWNPWSGLRLRPSLRVTGPITLRGVAMGYPERESLGSFIQVSPSFFLLWGWELGALRLNLGAGFDHHIRFTSTPESSRGLEIVPGEARFGHLERLDFTDHAGVEALLEVGYAVTDRLRVTLGAGFSHASVRLLAEPRENPDLVVGLWRYMDLWSAQAGVSWRFGG